MNNLLIKLVGLCLVVVLILQWLPMVQAFPIRTSNNIHHARVPVLAPSSNRGSRGLVLSSSIKSDDRDGKKVVQSIIKSVSGVEEQDPWKARAILITVSAFYGTNFASVKILNDNIDPSIAALCRFTIAALVFSPQLTKIIKSNPTLVKGGLEIGLYSSLGYWAQSNALETTSASIVAFICSLAVIVVPLLDRMFGDKPRDSPWYVDFIAPVMASVGVGCLELGGTELPGIGSIWALLQPLFFGLGFWRIEKIIKGAKADGDAQGFTGAMMLFVCAFSLVWTSYSFFMPLMGDPSSIPAALDAQLAGFQHWQVVAALLWTGIVTTALTSFGENLAMKQLSAAESTVIYSTEPLWGTAFAAVTLGEQIGANTLVGGVLILLACMWSSFGPTLPTLGVISQESLAESTAEVMENIAANWEELLSKITPDVY